MSVCVTSKFVATAQASGNMNGAKRVGADIHKRFVFFSRMLGMLTWYSSHGSNRFHASTSLR